MQSKFIDTTAAEIGNPDQWTRFYIYSANRQLVSDWLDDHGWQGSFQYLGALFTPQGDSLRVRTWEQDRYVTHAVPVHAVCQLSTFRLDSDRRQFRADLC